MLMVLLGYKWLMAAFLSMPVISSSLLTGQTNDLQKNFHPFYLSVTEINHNPDSKALEISCKMFADDFEAIIEKNYNTTLDITTDKDKVHFDKYVPDYITKHITIDVNGKPVKLNYVGFEVDKESAYVYMEVPSVSQLKNIIINNTLLYDFTEGQINIVHVIVNGKRKSTKVVNPHSRVDFSF
jgi:histone deacetylase complex regulatory component SIN3